jgi:hypothetical protein
MLALNIAALPHNEKRPLCRSQVRIFSRFLLCIFPFFAFAFGDFGDFVFQRIPNFVTQVWQAMAPTLTLTLSSEPRDKLPYAKHLTRALKLAGRT